ncbi:5-formyltetrahydrofolate cyclo-ligase [Pseudorhodobacter aquimaris]|uniref:5-formyltetrahydrofolate cyclo-ligase n=1 Tax=Pseudorhodobacter aquimaris TaxID=687412 RepID=UPI00067B15C8|nr:5-formyltetrahydrofolate cyclo-ligase [Pseudorhodobacter aquimaris]
MEPAPYASSPCQMPEDAETRRDVMRWRVAERARLIALRQSMPVADRQHAGTAIRDALTQESAQTIGIYWPFKGEPDLRDWAKARQNEGAHIALPVVVKKAAPLVFREWTSDAALIRGVWNIPIPPADAPIIIPDIIISPVVGVDQMQFRLGYGGGFYDRTLAAFRAAGHSIRVIGIGFAAQSIPTIFPLPHDIAMDHVILA